MRSIGDDPDDPELSGVGDHQRSHVHAGVSEHASELGQPTGCVLEKDRDLLDHD